MLTLVWADFFRYRKAGCCIQRWKMLWWAYKKLNPNIFAYTAGYTAVHQALYSRTIADVHLYIPSCTQTSIGGLQHCIDSRLYRFKMKCNHNHSSPPSSLCSSGECEEDSSNNFEHLLKLKSEERWHISKPSLLIFMHIYVYVLVAIKKACFYISTFS